MKGLKRTVEIALVFIVFPLALAVWAAVAVAVGLQGLAMYLGGTLGAWLLIAIVLPMLTGVMAPREVLDGIRSRRRARTHHEGEPLPNALDVRLGIPSSRSPRR
jgi:hypothetical protein